LFPKVKVVNALKKYKIGYTAGVFDLFHVGHLNLLRNAKEYCDFLIVGVNSDDLTLSYKGKRPTMPQQERLAIVESIRYVDNAVLRDSLDKISAWQEFKFDALFIGSDWKNTDRWNETEKQMTERGVDVIYLPYTKGTSSTLINEVLNKLVNE
jgi:glycerol-3-phosphate cytidylyltransferase